MTLWGHALRRIRHLHVRPSPLALCTRASGTPRLLSTCIPLSAEATAVNPLDKAMSQSQRYRDLTSPLQKLEQLVDHYYQERLTDGYIPVNNFVYRDRLWALYEQIPKDTVLTAEQYHALVSIAPVSRTSPEKAVERIESVLKKMVYQGYAIGERALVSLLFAYKGQPNARDKVETLLAQWPHSPTQTSGVYHVLLQVYAAQVGMTKAESWLNSKIGTLVYSEYDGRRVERPLIKNEPFYGTIMTGYAIEGKFDMAVLKLREFLSTNPRHRTRVVNKFLYALVRNGKHKEAISWFYEVRKYGIPSDRLTFDTILAAVFKLQIQQNAVPTLLDIQTQIGKEESVTAFSKRETDCRPGTGTAEGKNSQNASSNTPQQPTEQDQKDFSAMGSCLVDSMPESNTIALNVFNQMIASGYSPKISTLNIFLTTYMHAKLYTHVITLFEHMKQHMDIHADAGTYSIVLKSLSLLGRHNDVVSLAKEISQDFIEIDMVLYSTLMDVYGRAGKYDEALEFYDQIVTSGQKPSILCLQILMHVHCLRNDMESATRVLEQIIEQSPGKRPTDIQMTIIVHGYCLIGDFVKSQDTFNRMSEMGVAPTLETYNTMMYACVLTNKIEEAIKYYTDILNAGLSPDSVTFNILMQCFARRQDEGGAFEVYKSILDSGFAPSSHTVTALTRLLLDGKKYDEATALQDQLFTEYPSTRLSMDPHLVLMRSLSETEKLDEMIRIFYRATETFGLEPTIDTYEVLIRAHAGKDLAGAEKWFKAALDRCPNILHAKLYAAIMLGYRHAKQYEKVKELYEDMKERGVKANVEVYMIMTHISGEQKSRRPGTSGERKKTSY